MCALRATLAHTATRGYGSTWIRLSMSFHGIAAAFAGFERRDWLTLLASSAALSVSLLTYVQRSRAAHMALRRQLTDLLQKLSDLTLQSDTFRAMAGKPQQDAFPRNYLALLNDQRRFLVRQAEYVTRQIDALVSPYEWLLIAAAFDAIDDNAQATRYYHRAVSTATTSVDRGIALRQYARSLSTRGFHDDARVEYARAVAAFEGDTDDMRLYRIHTYERWAHAEHAWECAEEAAKRVGDAIAECERIANPRRQLRERERLAQMRGGAAG